MHKLMKNIREELEKIGEKGLTTSNLETAYKLVDMLKDIATYQAMEGETSGYMDDGESYRRPMEGYRNREMDYSGRRRRDSRGRYMSSASDGRDMVPMDDPWDRYQSAKRNYRNGHSGAAKSEMMDALNQYLEDFSTELDRMSNDSDCQEERQMIKRYVQKIKEMMD